MTCEPHTGIKPVAAGIFILNLVAVEGSDSRKALLVLRGKTLVKCIRHGRT
ncbi:MAG: hypothetical protein KBE27_04685 [Syntrophorhabdaceae bacterium]|nr:hypothetical protein [Syntrophorhabdaceae bacterium]